MNKKTDSVGKAWKQGRKDSYRFAVSKRHIFRIRHLKTTFLKNVIRNGKVKKGSKLLDVGCGGGADTIPLALMGCEVTALDINKHMIKNLIEYKTNVENFTKKRLNIKTIVGDMMNIKLKDNHYDVVFSNGVLEHYLDKKKRKKFIEKMVKCVKTGGYSINTVPNGKHPFRQKFKKEGWAGYTENIPEIDYTKELLEQDFNQKDIKIISIDGMYLFTYVLSFPILLSKLKYLFLPFYMTIRILERFFPKTFKRRFGFWLLCIAKKET